MKSRELERQMRQDGSVLAKTDGDHHVWKLPNGRMMTVPVGGGKSEAKSYLLARYRRLLSGDLRTEGRRGRYEIRG